MRSLKAQVLITVGNLMLSIFFAGRSTSTRYGSIFIKYQAIKNEGSFPVPTSLRMYTSQLRKLGGKHSTDLSLRILSEGYLSSSLKLPRHLSITVI